MQRTKIEWVRNQDGSQGYTINPVKGLCKNNCWYCYAAKMYKRFGWDKHIRLDLNVFGDIQKLKKPSKIFVGSMHDIFGNWIPHHWISEVIDMVSRGEFQKHIFIFLTKFSKRYIEFQFPKNCWLGVTITGKENYQSFRHGVFSGMDNIRFISYEPLLAEPEPITKYLSLDWIIIGGLTPKPVHKKEWVQDIINQARELDIPVFIKDNCHYEKEYLREFPKGE